MDFSESNISVFLGENEFQFSESIFNIDGIDVLKFDPPEEKGAPPLLSGIFCDEHGKKIFEINKNEWFGPLDAWDIEVIGQRIIIRSGKNKIALRIRLAPPNKIFVEKLNMKLGGARIYIDKILKIERIYENRSFCVGVSGLRCVGASSCVYINTILPTYPYAWELRMIGGGGIHLYDTGVVMGRGAVSLHIPNIKILC